MRHHILPTLTATVALIALAGSPALAGRQQGMNMGTPMAYDMATERTLAGTIDDVMSVPGANPMSGTHIVVKTKDGIVHVHVGPTAYLAANKIAFKKGEQVEVLGSLVKGEGFEAVLARRITRGGHTVTLRKEDGTPLWSMAMAEA